MAESGFRLSQFWVQVFWQGPQAKTQGSWTISQFYWSTKVQKFSWASHLKSRGRPRTKSELMFYNGYRQRAIKVLHCYWSSVSKLWDLGRDWTSGVSAVDLLVICTPTLDLAPHWIWDANLASEKSEENINFMPWCFFDLCPSCAWKSGNHYCCLPPLTFQCPFWQDIEGPFVILSVVIWPYFTTMSVPGVGWGLLCLFGWPMNGP